MNAFTEAVKRNLRIRPLRVTANQLGGVLLLLAAAQVFGQVSLVDPSFRIGSGPNGPVDALVVQADQRILVGGEFTAISGCSNSFLARLSADGSVDCSFDPAGQTDGLVRCLLQQPDGKVLVGGGFGRLLGQQRPALARLLANGSIDASFGVGTVLGTNTDVYAVALQDDGRLLTAYSTTEGYGFRIVRLNTNGTLDATFACTNLFGGLNVVLLPQPGGSLLLGGNGCGYYDSTNYTLFRLKPDGQVDAGFDSGLEFCSAFSLVRQTNGQILVGGSLRRRGASNSVPLLRLNRDLTWDETFHPDAFVPASDPVLPAYVCPLVLQPDGKFVAGGWFFEAGGYWRRHIVRFTAEGHMDGCFDPGLGLGASDYPAPARTLALQPDGRILVGGQFTGVDTAFGQWNLARLMPQNGCDLIRVYLRGGDQAFAAATFPPGGTNYLDFSVDLKTWEPVQTNSEPYIWYYEFSVTGTPCGFFRARQER
jgi:uncharacterized delta-60 repeat protein